MITGKTSIYTQDITFIRTNQVALGDPRLAKQVKALVDYGYNVTILAWDRELEQKPLEILEGALIKNFRLKAPSGKLRIIFYYPIFWIWVLLNTFLMRLYVIHACNLDAGVIGYFCKKLSICQKFVFDIFDGFALPMATMNFIELWLPTKVFEYQGYGKPIICISGGEAARYVESTKSGLIVKPNNARGFAEAIIRIYKDEKLAAEFGYKWLAACFREFESRNNRWAHVRSFFFDNP
ncbi:MAG: glycosyltransferase [Dehalococcoidia bacterium]|nr:MAG: glycosyltransferase [Dehalococcoidia bacterium]